MKMNTYSGKRFDPMCMKPEDIEVADICHALSLLCRGAGQIRRFYSVAQHSINCAKEAQARNYSNRVILACLLHDSSEAYLADVIRPIKKHLTNYNAIEDKVLSNIFAHFGLTLSEEEAALWKQIDNDLLESELKELMPGAECLEPVQLCSVPDLSFRSFEEVEQEMKDMIIRLESCI
ncbi:MAG: HD domain-containing protein [Bacillota bacterium]|nr:HD domain-containing protein [Bacillota bacterium]